MNTSKQAYEKPELEIIFAVCEDVLTASGEHDNNQGEWDNQYEKTKF